MAAEIVNIGNSSFKITAKDDPKDLLEVEIGDAKQEEFYPQIKLMRWSNEVNFSVRLKDTEHEKAQVSTLIDKIIWEKGNIKIEYYDYPEGEGGMKMVWFLKEKPATNKVEFSLQSKDAVFYYQPPLTQEYQNGYSKEFRREIVVTETQVKDLEGNVLVERPENVVGSYAVYHSTKGGMNDIYGKEYKTGKMGHIYRSKVIDANGDWIWEDLKIENGKLIVTTPQDFLDKAVYPIKSNSINFGYEEIGPSSHTHYADNLRGSVFPSGGTGTVDNLKVALNDYSGTENAKGVIVLESNLNIIDDGISSPTVINTVKEFKTFTFPTSPTIIDTDYVLMVIVDGQTNYYWYDSNTVTYYQDGNDYDSPSNPTGASSGTRKYSIYCTYTPAGGEEYIMTVTVGAFALTGVSALLTKALNIACAVGSFVLTGIDTALKKALKIAAAVGSFVLTGIDTALKRGYTIVASIGEFVLTGVDIGLKRGWKMAASVGTFALTGVAASFTKALKIACSVGSFALTGIVASFTKALSITASVGSFALTGINIGLKRGWKMTVSVGKFTLTGVDVTLTYVTGIVYTLVVSVGVFVLTGVDVALTKTSRAIFTRKVSPYSKKAIQYSRKSSPYSKKLPILIERVVYYSKQIICPFLLQENWWPLRSEDRDKIRL